MQSFSFKILEMQVNLLKIAKDRGTESIYWKYLRAFSLYVENN